MKKILLVVTLLVSACTYSDETKPPAAAKTPVCYTDVAPEQTAPKNWKKIRVAGNLTEAGSRLLGINGERVVDGTGPEALIVGGGVSLGEYWANQVDWSAYQHTASDKKAGLALYFDYDVQGVQHLCRIETEEALNIVYSDNEDDIEPKSVDLKVVAAEQFRYDINSLLLAIESRYWDDEQTSWQTRTAICYQYTASGKLGAVAYVGEGRCSTLEPSDIYTHYVYDDDNRLLRVISSEDRTEMGENQYEKVMHPTVDVYDMTGKLIAEYRETVDRTPFRKNKVPATESSNIVDTWVMENPPRSFRWTEHWGDEWVIVAVPASEEVSYYYNEIPEFKQLAKGKTDKKSLVKISKASLVAIRDALHAPDTVVAFYSRGQVYIITPALEKEVWQSCLNPGKTSRIACP